MTDELSPDLHRQLQAWGITAETETALRQELERYTPGFNLFRLTPAAAKRWKCRYRILLGEYYYDANTVIDVYARALLALLEKAGQ